MNQKPSLSTAIGLLGCGNIGSIVSKRDDLNIVAVYDIDEARAQRTAESCGAYVCTSFQALLGYDVDTLVEAASIDAVHDHAIEALHADKNLVIMSVGSLADASFYKELTETARARNCRVHIPSGAIAGLDAVRAAAIAGIERITLRTTKPPQALGIRTTVRKRIFQGSATTCITAFPKNINVAVALSLAARSEVQVEIWADPEVDSNIHEVNAEGSFGKIAITLVNVPCPDNPKTSQLAASSLISLLLGLDEPLVIGA